MLKSVRLRTIHWLETNQSQGAFDGFEEENIDFNNMNDEVIEWYFIEWFFTDDYIESLPKEELNHYYQEEMVERRRLQ